MQALYVLERCLLAAIGDRAGRTTYHAWSSATKNLCPAWIRRVQQQRDVLEKRSRRVSRRTDVPREEELGGAAAEERSRERDPASNMLDA
jgi:hypothetical protein